MRAAALLGLLLVRAEAAAGKTIEEEPSWVVVVMLFSFLLVSILVEHTIEWLHHKLHNREGLVCVLEKVKDELMLMGFISLALVALEDQLLSICIPLNAIVGVPCFFDPSHRQLNYTTGHGRRLLAAASTNSLCEEGYTKFLDLSAIHHIHILIFVIAVAHISYSCILILLAETKMSKWTGWESYGDDPKETIDLLMVPPQSYGWLKGFVDQFWNSLDAMGFLNLKRYFLSRNGYKTDFQFGQYAMENLEHDFHDFVGISWWMWFVLMAQVFCEGYGIGKFSIFAIISIFFTFYASTRSRMILTHLSRGVYDIYSEGGVGNSVRQATLDKLQHEDDTIHNGLVHHIEPEPLFYCSCFDYSTLKFMIRYVMFQNSSSLSMSVFYLWQVGKEACYFNTRSYEAYYIQIFANVAMLVHMSLVTVPLYSTLMLVVSHTNENSRASTMSKSSVGGTSSSKVAPAVSKKATPLKCDEMTEMQLRENIEVVFKEFDADGDGKIDAGEFKVLWEALGGKYEKKNSGKSIQEPTREESKFILESLDEDGDGFIMLSEFVSWISSGIVRSDEERDIYAKSGKLQSKLNDFLTLIKFSIDNREYDSCSTLPTELKEVRAWGMGDVELDPSLVTKLD